MGHDRLIGRNPAGDNTALRAYVLGLLGYGIGALAMALAQGLIAIIVFWAIVGGIGASQLLPSMQSLIHGNFEGGAQRQAYALVGAAAAIAAAVGPLLGGFITTYLSWRIAFLLEDVIIVFVLSGIRLIHDVEYTGSRRVGVVGAAERQQVAKVLEHDAEVVSKTQLEKQLAGQPQKTQDEIIRINTQARQFALQVALLIPILAGLAGLLISFRMMRLPDPQQSGSGEQMVVG
jgi:MFS family permease